MLKKIFVVSMSLLWLEWALSTFVQPIAPELSNMLSFVAIGIFIYAIGLSGFLNLVRGGSLLGSEGLLWVVLLAIVIGAPPSELTRIAGVWQLFLMTMSVASVSRLLLELSRRIEHFPLPEGHQGRSPCFVPKREMRNRVAEYATMRNRIKAMAKTAKARETVLRALDAAAGNFEAKIMYIDRPFLTKADDYSIFRINPPGWYVDGLGGIHFICDQDGEEGSLPQRIQLYERIGSWMAAV